MSKLVLNSSHDINDIAIKIIDKYEEVNDFSKNKYVEFRGMEIALNQDTYKLAKTIQDKRIGQARLKFVYEDLIYS